MPNVAILSGLPPPNVGINFNFSNGFLPGGMILTRGSSGTYIDVNGILKTATTNVARFNYDANYPLNNSNNAPSLTGPFLLYEAAATNLALQSNAFTTSPWFKTGSAVATSAVFTSPDGTNDGWSLTSGTGFGGTLQPITFSNIAYAASIWTYRLVGTPPLETVLNNINSGSVTTTASIKRYTYTGTPNAGSNDVEWLPNAVTGNTLGIFGAQLETGSVATSYIVTAAGTATRSADAAVFNIPMNVGHLIVTFDDNSTQSIAVTAGTIGYSLTTTLNRPNIKTIVGSV